MNRRSRVVNSELPAPEGKYVETGTQPPQEWLKAERGPVEPRSALFPIRVVSLLSLDDDVLRDATSIHQQEH
ncbi:MAG: hypothetical protein WA581_14065, partial [Candidatus Acidiferrales bacterium]